MFDSNYTDRTELTSEIRQSLVNLDYLEQMISRLESRLQDDRPIKVEGFDVLTFKKELIDYTINKTYVSHKRELSVLLDKISDYEEKQLVTNNPEINKELF